MPNVPLDDPFNPNNPYTAIALLGERVANLGKEKEALERALAAERDARLEYEAKADARIEKMERAYWKGAGILLALSTVGTFFGIVIAYGKTIFAPWLKQ